MNINTYVSTNHLLGNQKNFFKGQPTLNIIEQMKNGNTAYTRFNEWSKQYEEVIPLKGFSNAYNTLKIMYSKL